ncbi:MAG TPA: Ku protein [Candidatus Margulisiibacteriota bacterium]|nr:Ku protein [Candidatus Margulisiibacteriota bacterium]
MPAHAIASGTISFGLVSVPVKLYAATKSKSVSFNLLHGKDKSRLRQQYVCATCGEIVERTAMLKGYEYAKDQYAVLSDDELRALQEKTEQSIEIEEFVPISTVDPIYFEKTYLLGPDKGGQKAYRLLCDAMAQAGKGAVAKFATRGKQELVVLRQAQGGLMMHALFYADEVRGFEEIDRGEGLTLKAGELDLAVQLIEQLASPAFEPTKYEDDYRKKVLELIEQKVAGQAIVAAPAQPARAQIIDLMEALKASLAAKQAAAPAAAAQRRPAQAKGRPAVARKVSAKAK